MTDSPGVADMAPGDRGRAGRRGSARPRSRQEEILQHLDPRCRGVEIGPWHNPLCAKRHGWNVQVMDVFDTATIRQRAADDPNIRCTANIESVDIVGPAHAMAELVPPGSLDFVVSSHNFEHLPDPVRFLRAVETVLRPGGVLSMAVPDRRFTFDRRQPASTLGDMLEAYVERRERPTARQVFDFRTLFTGAAVTDPATAWAEWMSPPADYQDVHCWMLTPETMTEILAGLRAIGLLSMDVIEVSLTRGFEFFVHLRKKA